MDRTTTGPTEPIAALLVGLGAFQIALAVGAPWGRAAYGGQHAGVLPGRLRVVSAVAAVAYGAAVASLVAPATATRTRQRVLMGVVALAAPSIALNGLSRSPLERAVWTPYCAATTGAALWAMPPRR